MMKSTIPELSLFDRLVAQTLLSERSMDNDIFVSRQNSLIDVMGEDFKFVYNIISANPSGKMPVSIQQRIYTGELEPDSVRCYQQTISDYLDTDNPHPSVVFIAFNMIANNDSPHYDVQYHLMDKIKQAVDFLCDKYGENVFQGDGIGDIGIKTRYVGNEFLVDINSYSPTTFLRHLINQTVAGTDIDASKRYMESTLDIVSRMLDPVHRVDFFQKINTIFNAQLKKDKAYDINEYFLLSENNFPTEHIPEYNLNYRNAVGPAADAFESKARQYIEIPPVFRSLVEPNIAFDNIELSDLLMHSESKRKYKDLIKVVENQICTKGLNAVIDDIVNVITNGTANLIKSKLNDKNKSKYWEGNNPFLNFNECLNIAENRVFNIAIAITQFDRLSLMKGSVIDIVLEKIERLHASQDEELQRHAAIAIKLLTQMVNLESTRFSKASPETGWDIRMDGLANAISKNFPLEEEDKGHEPMVDPDLVSQQTALMMVKEEDALMSKDYYHLGNELDNMI